MKSFIRCCSPLPSLQEEGRRRRRRESTPERGLVWGLGATWTPWRSSLCWWWAGRRRTPSAPETAEPRRRCWRSARQTCRWVRGHESLSQHAQDRLKLSCRRRRGGAPDRHGSSSYLRTTARWQVTDVHLRTVRLVGLTVTTVLEAFTL